MGSVDFVVILSGDGRYDFVTEHYANGNVDRVLLLRSAPERLYECGVVPYPHERARGELIRQGVDAEDFVLIDTPVRDLWDAADQLDGWLADRPEATVACVADRLSSGTADVVFRQVLDADAHERVRIHALRDRRYDESDWWRSRRGIKSFYGAAVSLMTARFAGRPEYYFQDDWDPDAYERELREVSQVRG